MSERDFDSVFARAAPIEGWLTREQAQRLWERARAVPEGGMAVEIGSFRGRSAVVIASALSDGSRLVAIDPHAGGDRGPQEIAPEASRGEDDNAAFRANVEAAGLSDHVEHIRAFSSQALNAVDGPVDFLYVDGAHRFGPARDDLVRWGARVRDGGTMLVHDSFTSVGVTLATLATLTFSPGWRYAGRTGSLAEYRRERLGAGARMRDAASQLAELPWFARNVLVKLAILARLRPLLRLLRYEGDAWPY